MELSLELANKIRVYNFILYTLYVATYSFPARYIDFFFKFEENLER